MTYLTDEFNEPVRCPRCGALAEDNLFFADEDPDMEHPFCECDYEWQVTEDVQIVHENSGIEYGYGMFPGGDPRTFSPDLELCSEEEIANWREDCDKWDRGDQTVYPGNHFPILDQDGNEIGHVTAPRYGIGTYSYSIEEDEPDDDLS